MKDLVPSAGRKLVKFEAAKSTGHGRPPSTETERWLMAINTTTGEVNDEVIVYKEVRAQNGL